MNANIDKATLLVRAILQSRLETAKALKIDPKEELRKCISRLYMDSVISAHQRGDQSMVLNHAASAVLIQAILTAVMKDADWDTITKQINTEVAARDILEPK